jgi:RecB family endonuclease NucS
MPAHHNFRKLVKEYETPFTPWEIMGQDQLGILVIIRKPFS